VKVRLLIAAVAVAAGCGPAPRPGDLERPPETVLHATEVEIEEATADFIALRDAFLPAYYEARPVRATELGIHEHDARLPAMDRAGIQRYIDRVLEWLAELESIPLPHLQGDLRYDYGVLEFALRGELLEMEEIRSWVRDPRVYTEVIGRGIAGVAERPSVPLSERAEAIVSRMDAASGVLEAARENVSVPPSVWTERAVEDTHGLIVFLEEDLPAMLSAQAGATDAMALHGLGSSRDRLVGALRDHLEWLEQDLAPRSTGEFRLGRFLLERKLLYEEHIALSVDELDQLNERAIAGYREQLARTAAEIDPRRTPRAILDSLALDHPEAEELLGTARAMMVSARDWVARSGVVGVPDEELPAVRDALPYARAQLAALDGPGPFSDVGAETYYRLTHPLPGWPADRQEAYLRQFNRQALLVETLNRTFPGRYVQAGYQREVENELRQVFTPRSFVEGWAHYAEQMALDEGFGEGDPALRLEQVRRALERHARWYAALHLHALGAPVDEVVARYMEIAHVREAEARREVIRGTYDPTYLYSALGRMQILDIREDYQERVESEGGVFSIAEFHDRVLRLALPLPLVRERLLPLPDEAMRSGRPTARRTPSTFTREN